MIEHRSVAEQEFEGKEKTTIGIIKNTPEAGVFCFETYYP